MPQSDSKRDHHADTANGAAAASQAAANATQAQAASTETQVNSPARSAASSSPTSHPTTAESLGVQGGDAFSNQVSPLALMGAPFALPSVGNDETPKRKRGRPPKKDVVARAKADAEKTLKQFPMWGYGMPMPLLPGFPGMLASGTLGALGDQVAQAQEETAAKDEDSDSGYDKTGRGRNGKGPAKKKTRGTGKPRGRPRTRPRPGEIIRRAKPAAIAPANYSVMYNYSLSNLAQKSSELSSDANSGATHDENRLAGLGASLLSGDHE
uniref:Uncharacterized protein n=1 Tax=Globisporangium ultimum (strain ATCC 200006 / CBS 805.95 / DAOM BR144) TaxID=431595 RepID=K3WSA7_GLOUD